MSQFASRVKETSTTTGTGNLTLAGAASGFKAFSDRFAVNARFYYAIVLSTEWEVGSGYLSGATTLVRETVLESSNSDAAVNFSAGTKDVFCTIPGGFVNDVVTTGKNVAGQSGMEMP